MRFCIDVRVDAQGDRRPPAEAARDAVDASELGFRLDVQAAHAPLDREADLGLALSYPREQRLRRVAARGEHARELAPGDDVEARAASGEQREQGKARVRLDRIADERFATVQHA